MDELLEQCLAGQASAWGGFVERYSGIIYAAVSQIMRTHLGLGAAATVDDVAQDVFLRLLKDDMRLLRTYDPARAKLSTWLTIVARSTALDNLRSRRPAGEPLEDQLLFIPAAPEAPDPDSDPISLPEGLLSARQELILHMLFDRDMEVPDVARALGIDEQTVRSTKHKAIAKLREYYEREGEE